jgi:hypothetical protein
MTFKEYLSGRRVTNTPAGDFTRDARDDGRLPDVKSWSELSAYLDGAAPGNNREAVIAAAREVWQGYQRKRGADQKRALLGATGR